MSLHDEAYARDVLRERWHVARVRDDPWTICTDHGVAVAVQPRYANKEAWAVVAQRIVDEHNAQAQAHSTRGELHFGTAVHGEFDRYLWAQRCTCGARYLVDEFPRLMCSRDHTATLGFTYRQPVKPPEGQHDA